MAVIVNLHNPIYEETNNDKVSQAYFCFPRHCPSEPPLLLHATTSSVLPRPTASIAIASAPSIITFVTSSKQKQDIVPTNLDPFLSLLRCQRCVRTRANKTMPKPPTAARWTRPFFPFSCIGATSSRGRPPFLSPLADFLAFVRLRSIRVVEANVGTWWRIAAPLAPLTLPCGEFARAPPLRVGLVLLRRGRRVRHPPGSAIPSGLSSSPAPCRDKPSDGAPRLSRPLFLIKSGGQVAGRHFSASQACLCPPLN